MLSEVKGAEEDRTGLAAGGTDEGQPGPRGHLPGAYAAYLRDPAGNKVCAYSFV